jgi:thiamine pyrophosphate-dependent acetolactate synthase large subunit-like protein
MPVFRVFGTSPGAALSPDARVIHLDPDHEGIGRAHTPEVGLAMSVAAGLSAIVDRLGDADEAAAARRAGAVAASSRLREETHDRMVAATAGAGIGAAALCQTVAGAVAPRDLVVDEALTSGRWLRAALGGRNDTKNWLAHRGSALGWGLPAAVGAKLADPSRRVMCVHGDGSFLFGVHALWTAARERLGVAVVVADNGGYEILRAGLEGLTGRPEGGWPGLALADPSLDLVAISHGFGASAERVEHRDQLGDALSDLWRRAEGGPAVLVVPVTGRTPAIGYPVDPPPARER